MKVYITLLSNKNYLQGVLVLHRSLKASESRYPLYCALSVSIDKETEHILEERAFGAFVSCILP